MQICGFDFLYNFFYNFLFNIRHSVENSALYQHNCTCDLIYVKYPLFLSDINETRIYSTDFKKNPQIPNFLEILPLREPSSMGTDGQTEMTKPIVTFRNFAKAPSKERP